MALQPGTIIETYAILATLDEGGMGEVDRAHTVAPREEGLA